MAHTLSHRIKKLNPLEIFKSLNTAIVVFEKASLHIIFVNDKASHEIDIQNEQNLRNLMPHLFSQDDPITYPDQSYTHIKNSKGQLHFSELRFHELPNNPKLAYIEIYLKSTPSAPSPSQSTPTNSSKQSSDLQILLVEDDPMNQAVMKSMIKQLGYDCDIVSNGLDALNFCIQKNYDMVLMDLMMPIMNGRQAISNIRSSTEIRKQPEIVIMTANILDLQACKKEYTDIKYFLSKPISLTQIEDIISNSQKNAPHPSPSSSNYHYTSPECLLELANSDDPKINRHLIKSMINAFKSETPNTLKKLDESIECENYNLIATHAHTLKNAYNSTGSTEALKLVSQMEDRAHKREKIAIIRGELQRLKLLQESIIEELKTFENEL